MDLDDKLDAFYKDTRIWPLGRDMPAAMCGGRLNIESLQMDAYHYWKKVQVELAEAKKENETIRAELAEAKYGANFKEKTAQQLHEGLREAYEKATAQLAAKDIELVEAKIHIKEARYLQDNYRRTAITYIEQLAAKDKAIELVLNENFSGQSTLSAYAKRECDKAFCPTCKGKRYLKWVPATAFFSGRKPCPTCQPKKPQAEA